MIEKKSSPQMGNLFPYFYFHLANRKHSRHRHTRLDFRTKNAFGAHRATHAQTHMTDDNDTYAKCMYHCFSKQNVWKYIFF